MSKKEETTPIAEKKATITIKFERLQKVDLIYGSLLKEESFENTKLGYAFKRFVDKNKQFFVDYNEALHEVRIDNALTDEKTKALIIDNSTGRGYAYGKEELKKLLKEEK